MSTSLLTWSKRIKSDLNEILGNKMLNRRIIGLCEESTHGQLAYNAFLAQNSRIFRFKSVEDEL